MHKAYLRRFGVEIECGMDGGIVEAGQLFDFPFSEDDDWEEYPDFERGDGWTIHDDGSGVELATPVLQGESGYRKVREALDKLANAGAFVTDWDGLHVHHDAPEFVENPALCLPLLHSWLNNENTIREFVSPRRHDRGCCPRWTEHDLGRIEKWIAGDGASDDIYYAQRNDLNLASLPEHGTIEIRLMEGTLDADVTEAWIKFGQRLIHEVVQEQQELEGVPSGSDLLRRIKLSPDARAILAAKQAAGHLTPRARYNGDYYGDDD